MASAALKFTALPRRSIDTFSSVRCFSVSKGPPGKGGGGTSNNDSQHEKRDKSKGGGKKNKKVSQEEWEEQVFHRRPRFGPKSQKYFEAALNPHKLYGIRSLNLKLVKDSSEIPILIPGRTVKESFVKGRSSSEERSASGPRRQRRRRRKLPIVNAAALLDTTSYESAFPGGVVTKSGTDAAKRLLRGKKDLVDMLRGHIIFQQSQRPFCLAGHGVPKQLLQDHVNFADSILQRCGEPAECSFTNLKDEEESGPYPDCMRIRGRDGKGRIWAWPPPTQREQLERGKELEDSNAVHTWEERLALYLAVMDRFANKLGLVGSYLQKGSQKRWNVKIYRGMAYPLEVISRPDGEEDDGPVPILEWSPHNRASNKQPHVSIRIQGVPDHPADSKTPARDPVTLVYDALFQDDPRVQPVASD